MNRIKSAAREGLIILGTGVVISFALWTGYTYLTKPTIGQFTVAYMHVPEAERETVALDYLRSFPPQELTRALEDATTDTQTFCHSEAHPLGRAIYQKTQNLGDAVRQCGSSCTYGCFHGVLMGVFSTDSDTLGGVINEESSDEYLAHVQEASSKLCETPEVLGVVHKLQCHHALGHVFAYTTDRNLPQALDACGVFGNTSAQASCRSGVFMEYIHETASSTREYQKSEAPCDAYPDDRLNCYRNKAYVWLYAWGGVQPALDACDAYGEGTNLCIAAVARAAATPSALKRNDGFEAICGRLSGEKRRHCIGGAILKVLDLSEDNSERICDAIAPDYKAACMDVRETMSTFIYYDDVAEAGGP